MRIHAGNGSVYLTPDWWNVDLEIPGYSFLASERPDLVEQNRTTLDRYYKFAYTTLAPVYDRYCVCDQFMDIRNMNRIPNQSVEEILAVQVLEHFPREEGMQTLLTWHRVLQPVGRLIVDVPDFEKLVDLMLRVDEDQKEYYYRMIFGSQKNSHAFHYDGFGLKKLAALLLKAGFIDITSMGNIFHHPYPSLTLSARRP